MERIHVPVRYAAWFLFLATALRGSGAELKPKAVEGFDRYVAENESRLQRQESSTRAFLTMDSLPGTERDQAESRLRAGDILVRRRDDTPRLPGALVHHWIGTVFLPGATLQRTLALVQDYDHLPRYYSPEVIRSQLLSHNGNDFRIFMRLRKHKVVTVVLDTEYDVRYGSLDSTHAFSYSRSTRVSEIVGPGEKGEHAVPAGDDHGFMWRLNSYWRFVQRGEGVIVECEAISLTRDAPTGLGWLIEPFVQNIPRESLEFTLRATRNAVVAAGNAQLTAAELR